MTDENKDHYIIKIPKPKRIFKFLEKHSFFLFTFGLLITTDLIFYVVGSVIAEELPNISLVFHWNTSLQYLVGLFTIFIAFFFNLWIIAKFRRKW